MFYETHVLRTLLHVRKTYVKERTLNAKEKYWGISNMRYSIYIFTMRLTYVKHAF